MSALGVCFCLSDRELLNWVNLLITFPYKFVPSKDESKGNSNWLFPRDCFVAVQLLLGFNFSFHYVHS